MGNITRIKQQKEFTLGKKSIGFVLMILLVFVFLSFTAEAKKRNFGKIVKNFEVEKQFKSGNLPTEYSYYFKGWKGGPEAIIGISHDYVMQSKLWKSFNPEEVPVKDLILNMYKRNSNRGRFFGAWLNDHNGEKMGVYFSDSKDVKIKMVGDKQIDYITPTIKSCSSRDNR